MNLENGSFIFGLKSSYGKILIEYHYDVLIDR